MIYFISDVHLGSLLNNNQREHEQKFVRWLNKISVDAKVLYLMGDIFDFWFEYKMVVPKGYTRVFGKLASMIDSGIEIHFLTGNHDTWAFHYFQTEIGMKVHYKPILVQHNNQQFYLAHGDGLRKHGWKPHWLSKLFHCKFLQRLFALVPPFVGQKLGYEWSRASRAKILKQDNRYKGENKEELIVFAKMHNEQHPNVDYYVFGHRHIDLLLQFKNNSQVLILGDFVSIFSYGVFDGTTLHLEYFDETTS